jgi:hypothetical protein
MDVYVRPFPAGPGVQRVSYSGGGWPHWSAASRELLFVTLPNMMNVMVAPYSFVGESFSPEKPRPWATTSIQGVGLPSPYDIHPDGKRLAVVGSRDESPPAPDSIVFVFNFFDHLRKLAPGAN